MLKLRHLPLAFAPALVLMQCGGSTPDNDAGTDASPQDSGKDSTTLDSGKDATTKDVVTFDAPDDVVTNDAPDDVIALDAPTDSPADASDASDASVADAPADVTPNDGGTIAAISGLVLWLDAAKGVTTNNNAITAWADQSSQGNNASGGTAAPTLVSSSINALPAAHFVASSNQYVKVADATSLQFGTGDYYIAVVAKFDNSVSSQSPATSLGTFYAKLGQGSGLLFFGNDYDEAQQTVAAGLCNLEDPSTQVNYAASYNDGAARLYAVERASATETLRVNGTQVASASSSVDVSESGQEIDIGYMAASAVAPLDGDIAEMIVVKGTLSSSDLSNIESYLTSKYGL